MAALTKDRNTPKREGDYLSVPLAASTKVYAGGIAMLNSSGYAKPGTTATGETYIGRFNETVDNTSGANGALSVLVERKKAFKFNNSAADPIGQSGLLKTCYVVDDQTVAATNGTGTRSAAGIVIAIESDGVWVE